jgi:hypothetical protein
MVLDHFRHDAVNCTSTCGQKPHDFCATSFGFERALDCIKLTA